MPQPSARCNAPGMALCIDFEGQGVDAFRDGTPASSTMIDVSNVTTMERLPDEDAARFQPRSSFQIGENDRLDIPGALTIEMWANPQAVPWTPDKQVGLFDNHLQYQMNLEQDLRIECRLLGGDYNVDSNAAVTLGSWHHVACTYDGATLKVYVNGRLEGCKDMQRTVSIEGTFGSAIGANMDIGPQYKNPFVGELDNVHVYARALTAQEICSAWGYGSCDDTCPGDE
jgi:hypothetical protein